MYSLNVPLYRKYWPEDGLVKTKHVAKNYVLLTIYEACLESKDTKVLNMYNNLNLQKRHCE